MEWGVGTRTQTWCEVSGRIIQFLGFKENKGHWMNQLALHTWVLGAH